MSAPNGCPLALADDPIGWCSVHGCYVDRCPSPNDGEERDYDPDEDRAP